MAAPPQAFRIIPGLKVGAEPRAAWWMRRRHRAERFVIRSDAPG
jgi:hypothetical protein